jgi:tetratricopeptide (TPR) repeat protein
MTTMPAPPPPPIDPAAAARRVFRRGDLRTALRLADERCRALPDDPDARQARALALFALGRYDEAGRAVRADMEDGTAWDWATLGRYYERTGDYVKHYDALRRAALAPQGTADAQMLLAYHSRVIRRASDTRAALARVLQARPDDELALDLQDAVPPPQP